MIELRGHEIIDAVPAQFATAIVEKEGERRDSDIREKGRKRRETGSRRLE